MENKRIVSKSTIFLLILKLFIINGSIFAFGFGVYHLTLVALEDQNPALLGAIIPLGLAVIALITLEINSIYKFAMKILEYRYNLEIKNDNNNIANNKNK